MCQFYFVYEGNEGHGKGVFLNVVTPCYKSLNCVFITGLLLLGGENNKGVLCLPDEGRSHLHGRRDLGQCRISGARHSRSHQVDFWKRGERTCPWPCNVCDVTFKYMTSVTCNNIVFIITLEDNSVVILSYSISPVVRLVCDHPFCQTEEVT